MFAWIWKKYQQLILMVHVSNRVFVKNASLERKLMKIRFQCAMSSSVKIWMQGVFQMKETPNMLISRQRWTSFHQLVNTNTSFRSSTLLPSGIGTSWCRWRSLHHWWFCSHRLPWFRFFVTKGSAEQRARGAWASCFIVKCQSQSKVWFCHSKSLKETPPASLKQGIILENI